MDCGTRNVIYLISCRKCGIQYIGKTGQSLRSRFNNHRNRLKHTCTLYLYNHFRSDGHSLSDIAIMPIEEVQLAPNDRMTLPAKLLAREEFRYKELGSVYPYGLNDNVRGIDNVSKKWNSNLVVYALFHKHPRRYQKRARKRRKRKVDSEILRQELIEVLKGFRECKFTFNIRTFLHALPKGWLRLVWHITEECQLNDVIPSRVAVLVRDILAYRKRVHLEAKEVITNNRKKRMYLNVLFHNKGIEMLNIPGILHRNGVKKTVPTFLDHKEPPTVTYTYTKTISLVKYLTMSPVWTLTLVHRI